MVCNLYEIDTLRSVIDLRAAFKSRNIFASCTCSLRPLAHVELWPVHIGGVAGIRMPSMEQEGVVHSYDLHGGIS